MSRCAAIAVALALLSAPAFLQAQTPEALKKEIEQLKKLVEDSRARFEERLGTIEKERDTLRKALVDAAAGRKDLQEQLDEAAKDDPTEELERQLADLEQNLKFYLRPRPGRDERSLFAALQGGLIFTGLFRTRFEYRADNLDFNNDDDEGLDDSGVRLAGRFRLGFGAVVVGDTGKGDSEDSVRISALMEIQAQGTFSDNSQTLGIGGLFSQPPFGEADLYQAYLHFEDLIAEGVRIKIGRQELVFGNQLILGNNSFFEGATHGAVLAEWLNSDESLRVSAFYAKEAESDRRTGIIVAFPPPPSDFDEDEMAGLYVTTKPATALLVEFYAIYFNARTPELSDASATLPPISSLDGAFLEPLVGNFWTFGSRTFWSPIELYGGSMSINAEAAFQTGHNNPQFGTRDQSIHGWAVEILTNYRFDKNMEGWAPILTLGYYYVGGGDERQDGRHIGFQPLFLNRHFDVSSRHDSDLPYYPGGGRFGNMDLLPVSNIHVIKAALSVSPADDFEVGVAYHLAITADDEGYGTGVFGHEADLFAVYHYVTGQAVVQFSANVSVFFPQESAEDFSNRVILDVGGGFPLPGVFGRTASNDMALAVYLEALVAF